MDELSFTEENYLKTIYHLADMTNGPVATNAISEKLSTSAASVTDMLKKLAQKKLIDYRKYYGVTLTDPGNMAALRVIRKHRLWEVFLVQKLKFKWDEVHDIAEQLEHVTSPLLIERLDDFLGFPRVDPHGDPIPDKSGKVTVSRQIPLTEYPLDKPGVLVSLKNANDDLLKYLDKIQLHLGAHLTITDRMAFDGSHEIQLGNKRINISKEVADNLMLTE